MADTVFDSYIKSVYGSGSGLAYFDSIHIHGGQELDIFGGIDPTEIIEDLDNISLSDSDNESDNEDNEDNSNKLNKVVVESITQDEPIIEYIQIIAGAEPLTQADSVIGFIQIGLHTTPIISADVVGSNESDDTVSTMNLSLDSPKKDESVGPVEVGQMLIEMGA